MLAENTLGLAFRPGGTEEIRNAHEFRNIWMSALARPDCVECYALNTENICKNNDGYYTALATNGFFIPSKKKALNSNVTCIRELTQSSIFWYDSVFQNYRDTYTGFPNCGNNHLYTVKDDFEDSVSGNYVSNVTCENCEESALFHFKNPDKTLIGWKGGCGEIVCSGKSNHLFHDLTGNLLGKALA